MITVIGSNQGGPNLGGLGHKLAVGHPGPVGNTGQVEQLILAAAAHRCRLANGAAAQDQAAVIAEALVGPEVVQLDAAPPAKTGLFGVHRFTFLSSPLLSHSGGNPGKCFASYF